MVGSLRKYAAHRKAKGLPGGSLSAIQKAITTERIKLNAEGKIDFDAADAEWERNTVRKFVRGPKLASAPVAPQPATSAELPFSDLLDGERQPATLVEVSAALKWEEFRKKQREREIEEGRWLNRDDVKRSLGAHIVFVRNRLRYLPGDVAAKLAAMQDEVQIYALLETRIDDILAELEGYQIDKAA